MMCMLLRKSVALASKYNPHILLMISNFSSKGFTAIPDKEDGAGAVTATHSRPTPDYSSCLYLSPLFSDCNLPSNVYNIDLVDHDAWRISSCVAQTWQGKNWTSSGASSLGQEVINEPIDFHTSHVQGELDFEEIDNMRLRGNLFYKIERSSIEFEEYNLDFHRKKASKKKDDKMGTAEEVKKCNPSHGLTSKNQKLHKVREVKATKSVIPQLDEISDTSLRNKRQRTPTFNQLTGPYHEPFCLDIYISKASVRACIVHRVTSKVVVVTHSISKDMKFDLSSTRNKTTCDAVGAILAQRALADDIHDVIYTPRKGERLEGKLHIVLQSIINHGINVKVKIKHRQPKKSIQPHLT